MRVALVGGTGGLGPGLAARWLLSDIEVIIGSRVRERAQETASKISRLVDRDVEGMLNQEAVEEAEIIVLTIPFKGVEPTLKSLSNHLKGKTIISPIVSPSPALGTSAGELVRRLSPDSAKVASAFQNVGAHALAELEKPIDCDVVVCGDPEARETAAKLVEKIPNLRALDGGGIENSWIIEALTHLLIRLNKRYRRRSIGVRFTGL